MKKLLFKTKVLSIMLSALVLCPEIVMAQSSSSTVNNRNLFKRNGEAYLSVSGMPIEGKDKDNDGFSDDDGIYRLNDPEGVLGVNTKYPIKTSVSLYNLKAYAVDLDRNIYIIADPTKTKKINGTEIDEGTDVSNKIKLYRQVLDGTNALKPSSYERNNWNKNGWDESYSSTPIPNYPTDHVIELSGLEITPPLPVTDEIADYGHHSDFHDDHRRGSERGRFVYRTCQSGKERSKSAYWGRSFTVKPPTGALKNPPQNVLGYLPNVAKKDNDQSQHVVLSVYKDKTWYTINNGDWFSSWRARRATYGPGHYRENGQDRYFFYQVYRDYATVREFNWELTRWISKEFNNPKKTLYNSDTPKHVATTRAETFVRDVFAGCLDACGGASGSGFVEGKQVIVHPAFMAYQDKGKEAMCAVYTLVKNENEKFAQIIEDEEDSRDSKKLGAFEKDTRWIGVSKGPTGDRETDYIYILGTTQIQNWLGNAVKNVDISAVAVSNQWNEKGGILFAYDKSKDRIIKFTLKGDPDKLELEDHLLIPVGDLRKQFHASGKVSIDDIAADGLGNYYLSMTYPSTDASEMAPEIMGWNFNNAKSYTYISGSSDTKQYSLRFNFEVIYGKSVWKVSSVGNPPEEIGRVPVTSKMFIRDITVSDTCYSDIIAQVGNSGVTLSKKNASKLQDILMKHCKSAVDGSRFEHGPGASIIPPVDKSKLAVINTPTPPVMYSIYGSESYLDIIGAYENESTIAYQDSFTTNQDRIDLSDCSKLKTSTPYFFMVENYPVYPTQDPNQQPDYDGDGRVGGFISSVLNPEGEDDEGGRKGVKYYWNIWGIKDHKGNPYMNSSGSAPYPLKMNDSDQVFTVFYTPFPGKFIVTCCAEVSYYDYSTVRFGQTIGSWKAEGNYIKNKWALASAPTDKDTMLSSGSAPNLEDAKKNITSIVTNAFKNYQPDTSTGISYPPSSVIIAAFPDPIYNAAAKRIESSTATHGDPSQHIAVMELTATGTPPVNDNKDEDIVSLERHSFPDKASGWAELAEGQGFFGISSSNDSYWRIATRTEALDYQKMFLIDPKKDYADGDDPIVSRNGLYRDVNAKFYDYIANKLEDSNNTSYFANSTYNPSTKSGLKFDRNGQDIRWSNQDAKIYANLKYYVLSKDNKHLIEAKLPLSSQDRLYDNKEKDNSKHIMFKYFKIDGKALPPTDPYVGELTIEMTRVFEYDAYIYRDGDLLMSNPIRLPKIMKVVGKAYIMVVDTEPPVFLPEYTIPLQLNAYTGEELKNTSDSFFSGDMEEQKEINNNDSIVFALRDNNHLEARISQNLDTVKLPQQSIPVKGSAKKLDMIVQVNSPDEYKGSYANCKWVAPEGESKSTAGGNVGVVSSDSALPNVDPAFNTYNRRIYITFDTVHIKPQDSKNNVDYTKTIATETHYYEMDYCKIKNDGKAPVLSAVKMDLNETEGSSNDYAKQSTFMKFRLPLSKMYEKNSKRSGYIIPSVNYANNSKGYQPRQFMISATDCSGNEMTSRKMNLLLDIRDNIPPYPVGIIREFKNESFARFPQCDISTEGDNVPDYSDSDWIKRTGNALKYSWGRNTLPAAHPWQYAAFKGEDRFGDISLVRLPQQNKFSILPFDQYVAGKNITSNDYPQTPWAQYVPGNVTIQTNVETVISAGGVDNSGKISKITLKYLKPGFTSGGNSEIGTVYREREFAENDPIATSTPKLYITTRNIFRKIPNWEGYPYFVPLTITVEDDAYNWLVYSFNDSCDYSWPPEDERPYAKNSNEIKTAFPVYDASLSLRTIENYLRKRKTDN